MTSNMINKKVKFKTFEHKILEGTIVEAYLKSAGGASETWYLAQLADGTIVNTFPTQILQIII